VLEQNTQNDDTILNTPGVARTRRRRPKRSASGQNKRLSKEAEIKQQLAEIKRIRRKKEQARLLSTRENKKKEIHADIGVAAATGKRYWDPSWGWDDNVYCLKTKDKIAKFFMARCELYNKTTDEVIKEHAPARLCAGTFDDEYYYGSYSKDVKLPDQADQGIYIADKNFNIIATYEVSSEISGNHKEFGGKYINKQWCYPFRDPCPLPSTGEIACVTAGAKRWDADYGNVCTVKWDKENNKIKLSRRSIIDESIKIFGEIERACFSPDEENEWMFFSVKRGAATQGIKKNKMRVARLNKTTGLYELWGKINGSGGLYGMDIHKTKWEKSSQSKLAIKKDIPARMSLLAVYWDRTTFDIVIPKKYNLIFDGENWAIDTK